MDRVGCGPAAKRSPYLLRNLCRDGHTRALLLTLRARVADIHHLLLTGPQHTTTQLLTSPPDNRYIAHTTHTHSNHSSDNKLRVPRTLCSLHNPLQAWTWVLIGRSLHAWWTQQGRTGTSGVCAQHIGSSKSTIPPGQDSHHTALHAYHSFYYFGHNH